MSNYCENLINTRMNGHFLTPLCLKTIGVMMGNLKQYEGIGEIVSHDAIRFSSRLASCLEKMDNLVTAFCEYVVYEFTTSEFKLAKYATVKEEKSAIESLIDFYKKSDNLDTARKQEWESLHKKCATLLDRRSFAPTDELNASKYATISADKFIEICRKHVKNAQ